MRMLYTANDLMMPLQMEVTDLMFIIRKNQGLRSTISMELKYIQDRIFNRVKKNDGEKKQKQTRHFIRSR